MRTILIIFSFMTFSSLAYAAGAGHKSTHLTRWCAPRHHVEGCLPKPKSFVDYSKPADYDVNQ